MIGPITKKIRKLEIPSHALECDPRSHQAVLDIPKTKLFHYQCNKHETETMYPLSFASKFTCTALPLPLHIVFHNGSPLTTQITKHQKVAYSMQYGDLSLNTSQKGDWDVDKSSSQRFSMFLS